MRYLDTNILGYAVEGHPVYGRPCAKILNDVEKGKLHVACSLLVLVEFLGVLRKINKELEKRGKGELNVRANIDAVLSLPIVWIELTTLIVKRAAEYSYPSIGADQIHLVSMELEGIHEIISADTDFDKVKFIKRIDPKDY